MRKCIEIKYLWHQFTNLVEPGAILRGETIASTFLLNLRGGSDAADVIAGGACLGDVVGLIRDGLLLA